LAQGGFLTCLCRLDWLCMLLQFSEVFLSIALEECRFFWNSFHQTQAVMVLLDFLHCPLTQELFWTLPGFLFPVMTHVNDLKRVSIGQSPFVLYLAVITLLQPGVF
jgi:hypothetical protein